MFEVGTQLDLTLPNKEELVRDPKFGRTLGCRDHEMVLLRILRGGNKARSQITILEFRRADFGLFRNLLGRIPWDTVLVQRGVQDRGLIFQDHLIYTQELSISMCRSSS